MPRGGYQQPSNPAPVSGPGALSQRTDGAQPIRDLPNADYGEAKTYREQQQGAPMAASGPSAPGGAGPDVMGASPGGPEVIPFGAPSMRPDEPVTTGAAQGPGAGTDVMNFANERKEDIAGIASALPFLRFMANQPGSSWAARNAVRKMIAEQ